jgi:hypothetical protein
MPASLTLTALHRIHWQPGCCCSRCIPDDHSVAVLILVFVIVHHLVEHRELHVCVMCVCMRAVCCGCLLECQKRVLYCKQQFTYNGWLSGYSTKCSPRSAVPQIQQNTYHTLCPYLGARGPQEGGLSCGGGNTC